MRKLIVLLTLLCCGALHAQVSSQVKIALGGTYANGNATATQIFPVEQTHGVQTLFLDPNGFAIFATLTQGNVYFFRVCKSTGAGCLGATIIPNGNTQDISSTLLAQPYAGGGGGGAVSSVFSRTGAVIAQANDYNFNQLAGSASCSQLPALIGDATTSAGSCNSTVSKINGTSLASLGTGILKNTTGTGVPSIAAAGDIIGLFTGCSGTQYLGADGACHSIPVTSVFGRTGTVVAAANDYNFNQLAGQNTYAQLPTPLNVGSTMCSTAGPVYAECAPAVIGRVIGGTTDTVVLTRGNQLGVNTIYTNSSSMAVALTNATTNGQYGSADLNGTGSVTWNVTGNTIRVGNGSLASSATCTGPNIRALIQSYDGTNFQVDCLPTTPISITSLVSFTSSAQTGSLGSTAVVASTAADGFWQFYVTLNVTAQSPTPTATANISSGSNSCNSGAATNVSGTGTLILFLNTGNCGSFFIAAGSAINVTVTIAGTGSLTYTATVKAKFVD